MEYPTFRWYCLGKHTVWVIHRNSMNSMWKRRNRCAYTHLQGYLLMDWCEFVTTRDTFVTRFPDTLVPLGTCSVVVASVVCPSFDSELSLVVLSPFFLVCPESSQARKAWGTWTLYLFTYNEYMLDSFLWCKVHLASQIMITHNVAATLLTSWLS